VGGSAPVPRPCSRGGEVLQGEVPGASFYTPQELHTILTIPLYYNSLYIYNIHLYCTRTGFIGVFPPVLWGGGGRVPKIPHALSQGDNRGDQHRTPKIGRRPVLRTVDCVAIPLEGTFIIILYSL